MSPNNTNLTALSEKHERLKGIIKEAGKAAVAFSGGVDSTFLLKTAHEVLGENVLAVYAENSLQPPDEAENVRILVKDEIGCRLVVVNVDPLLLLPEYAENPPDRCYICKKKIYSEFLATIRRYGILQLMDGTNLDDLSEDRPGLFAIRELGVQTPLAEAGLTKREIRQLSRSQGISTWNRPSSSCLATRIPQGVLITRDKLSLVARLEGHMHSLGFYGCRVRLGRDGIVLEVVEDDVVLLCNTALRSEVNRFCSEEGFGKVLLDLSGRKNDLIGV
ncbi:MAG: ATP-dependent sacrificial sulfur transferase LarE [Desulfobulbaceae bacterium]|nr:ATP-dependent sacrificial sulfur transferase LarE [Desulfobulbaceae bacterium]